MLCLSSSFSLRARRHHECFLLGERVRQQRQSCLVRPRRRAFSPALSRGRRLRNRREKESRGKLLRSSRCRATTQRKRMDGLRSSYVRDLGDARNPCRAKILPLPKDQRFRRAIGQNVLSNRQRRSNVSGGFLISPSRAEYPAPERRASRSCIEL